MLHIVESKRPVREIEKDFQAVAAKHGFGVMSVHDLKSKMKDKGVPFDKECLIFEVCNPKQAKKVLEGDMGISTALPCRVSVYNEGGGTRLATIKPTAMLDMFAKADLKPVAEEVERVITAIMAELA